MTSTSDSLRPDSAAADLFADRAERFGAVLDAVGDRWDATTPCSGWSARDVVAHVVETERDFLARHDLLSAPAPDLADPAAGWREHADVVVATVRRDGVAGRSFDGYFGPTTIGATLGEFYGWDLAVHGWDVARAIGLPYAIDDDEAAALSAAADGWGEALYSEGICTGPVPVPDDATAFERLLGRLGRDPSWAP